MLVPHSRDRHKKHGDQILHTTKHTLNTLFEKSRLKGISNTINNITLISTK